MYRSNRRGLGDYAGSSDSESANESGEINAEDTGGEVGAVNEPTVETVVDGSEGDSETRPTDIPAAPTATRARTRSQTRAIHNMFTVNGENESDDNEDGMENGDREEEDNDEYDSDAEDDPHETTFDGREGGNTGRLPTGPVPEIDNSPRLNLDHKAFAHYQMKSGVDSINLISTNFNNFFDTLAMPGSVWTFSNTLRRTSIDIGSRYKVRYLGDLEAPPVAGGIKVKDLPVHLFPNMQIAKIAIGPGLVMNVSLHLIYPDMLRKANYFTELKLVIVSAGFNFARKKWLELPNIADLIRREKDKLDIQRRLQPLNQFRGQVGAVATNRNLKSVNHQIPSSYGRFFLRAVFEAILFFAEHYDEAVRMLAETGEDLLSPYFHGVDGCRPSRQEFIQTSSDIWNTGLLIAKLAGCKNAFEGNPEISIRRSSSAIIKKKRTNKFMRAAFEYHRKQMDDLLMYRSEFDEDGDYIYRLDDASKRKIPKDPKVRSDIEVTVYCKDGDLQVERTLGEVVMTYDVGFNIYTDNVEVSCIPKGAHACYFLSSILGQTRLYDVAAEWRNDPKACFMYNRLLSLKDNEFFMDIVDLFLNIIQSDDDGGLLGPDEGARSSIQDWDMVLLDMCQDELIRESGEDSNVFLNVVDILEEIRSREMFSYPILGTDGIYSNVHSGKALLLVSIIGGTDKLAIVLDESGRNGSLMFGGQIYDPNALKLSLKKILKYFPGMSRFAHALKSALFDGDQSAFLGDQLKNMVEIFKTIDWFEDFQLRRKGELSYTGNGATRAEFFIQLKREPFNEMWEKVPDILQTIQCVDSKVKAIYEYKLVEECLKPMLRFKQLSEPSVRLNQMPNYVNIPASHKVAIVMNAELLLMRINFFPFQRYFFKYMEIEGRTTRAHGNWVIPFACRTVLPGEEASELEQEANRLTGLEFGIKTLMLGTDQFKPQAHVCGEFYARVNSDQTLHYQADRMKKRMRCSFQYVKVMKELKCIMLAFMSVDPDCNTEVDDFEIQYGVFDNVDYGRLARLEDDKKLIMLMEQICLKVLTLYQASWYHALRSKKAKKLYTRPGEVHPGVILEHWSLFGVPQNTGNINVCVSASLVTENPLRFELATGFIETPGELMLMMFGPDPLNPVVDAGWNQEPLRHLYQHLLKVFGIIAGLVPTHLKTGRGNTAALRSHTVFSKDWLDYWIFTSMVKKRTGTTDMVGQDIPIVWWTSPTREFRTMGKYIRIRDNGSLAPLPVEEALFEDEGDAALLKVTRDDFWTMMKFELKVGLSTFNSSIWVGMMARKAIIDYLCELDKEEPRPTVVVLNQQTIANHIWVTMRDCHLKELWGSHQQLQEWLKGHLFKGQAPIVNEGGLKFLTTSYGVDDNLCVVGQARTKAWRAALIGTSKESVCALYAHLTQHKTGRYGMVRHSMVYQSIEDPIHLADGAINLPKALVESVVKGRTSPQLMHSLCIFRRLYQQARIGCAREAQAKGQSIHRNLEENQIFLQLSKAWGLGSRRIGGAPNNKKRRADQM